MNGAETVADLGEFPLIERLQRRLPEEVRTRPNLDIGIGDDCAVWRPTPGKRSVISTDTMVEEIDFRFEWTDWPSLGWKALAINLSDMAAMGARPVLATITLGLRPDDLVSDLEAMYDGVAELAAATDVVVAGGDIQRTGGPFFISITVVGEATDVLRRTGAQSGDAVVVTGFLGASGAGLELLRAHDERVGATTADAVIAAHMRPIPRLAAGDALCDCGASAGMDISDGLLGDAQKIATASGVAITIDADRVPVSPAVHALFPDAWLDLALRAGEDYELVATIDPERIGELQRLGGEIGTTFTHIGSVHAAGDGGPRVSVVGMEGQSMTLGRGAYEHFPTPK